MILVYNIRKRQKKKHQLRWKSTGANLRFPFDGAGVSALQPDEVGSQMGSYPVSWYLLVVPRPCCWPGRKGFHILRSSETKGWNMPHGHPILQLEYLFCCLSFSEPFWFYDFLFTHPPEMIKLMALRSLPQRCPSGSSIWRLTISWATSAWPNLWDKKPHLDLEFFFLIVSYVTFDRL